MFKNSQLMYLYPDVYKKFIKGIFIAFIPCAIIAILFSVFLVLFSPYITNLKDNILYIYLGVLAISAIISTIILVIIMKKIQKLQFAIFNSDTEKYKYYIEYYRVMKQNYKKLTLIHLILTIAIITFCIITYKGNYLRTFNQGVLLFLFCSIVISTIYKIKLKPIKQKIDESELTQSIKD